MNTASDGDKVVIEGALVVEIETRDNELLVVTEFCKPEADVSSIALTLFLTGSHVSRLDIRGVQAGVNFPESGVISNAGG